MKKKQCTTIFIKTSLEWNNVNVAECFPHTIQSAKQWSDFSTYSLFVLANIWATLRVLYSRDAHKANFTLARLGSHFEFTLANAILHSPARCLMCVYFLNFTLARLASDFEFTLANENLHSPWRYGDAYVHPCSCESMVIYLEYSSNPNFNYYKRFHQSLNVSCLYFLQIAFRVQHMTHLNDTS